VRSQFWRQNETLVAITIIVLSIIIGVINPAFFSVANLLNLLRAAIVMGILAMGVLIVIVSGGIDVSFTAVAIFAMYTTVEFFRDYFPGAPLLPMFVMSGAIGMLLGLINGFFIAQFQLPTLIVTLGTLSMFRGFLLFAIGNRIIRDVPDAMTAFARSSLWDVEMANGGIAKLQPGILVTVAVAIAVWLLLRYTMLGRSIFALGGAREAAARAGFNIKRVQYFIYVTVGLLAGIGGMMFGALSRQANPQDIAGTELDVIAAVVLGGASLTGGRGTVIGTVLGVTLVVIMTNSLILMGVPSTWQRVVIGAIILIGTGIPAVQARRSRRRISSITLEQPAQA
jgi:simple sugar transport system permease protein